MTTVIDRDTFAKLHVPRLLARVRSRPAGTDLTPDWLLSSWDQQGGRCSVCNLPFSDESVPTALVKHPFYPSLDQRTPGGGYTRSNVRLVLVAVNFALNEWQDDVLRQVAESLVRAGGGDVISRVDALFELRLRTQIAEAARVLPMLIGDTLRQQRSRVAGLKASLTKGRSGLAAAAARALIARKARDIGTDAESEDSLA